MGGIEGKTKTSGPRAATQVGHRRDNEIRILHGTWRGESLPTRIESFRVIPDGKTRKSSLSESFLERVFPDEKDSLFREWESQACGGGRSGC
jgi:hypothetical protein